MMIILSVILTVSLQSLNPGNLITDLQRTMPKWQLIFVVSIYNRSSLLKCLLLL